MKIWRGYKDINLNPGQGTALTLGNFDGVHQGHRHIISVLKEAAADSGLLDVVVTFDPHPLYVHGPSADFTAIMSLEQRLRALEACGVGAVLVIPYTLKFAAQTPAEFVEKTFVDALQARVVVAGHDTRFGNDNSGDGEILKELGKKYGFRVIVSDVKATGQGRYSSTQIRNLLYEGRVAEAKECLGQNHTLCGTVVHGHARGRRLGFPTANLQQDLQGCIPADGVYAGWLLDEERSRHPAAFSIGTNPTFQTAQPRQVEVYVINRPSGEPIEAFDLYGKFICLEFVERLRDMIAYRDEESLIFQMRRDVGDVQAVLSREKKEYASECCR